ncbi:MAG TPA: hypothetical protein VGW76_01650 [Pyrinomonadaceae bacterium]|nr:hypothetical protein [Pyrinomonadaceae bacterium]
MKDIKRKARLAQAAAGLIFGAIVGWIISAVALTLFSADFLINNPSGQMRSFTIGTIIAYSFIGAGFGAVIGIIIALELSSRAQNKE